MTPAVVPWAAPSAGAVAQPEGAQQGVPQPPQGLDAPQPDSMAPASPSMHHLAATMQLLHQIDLETADQHAGCEQLLPVLPPDTVSQQPSRVEHPAAADMAAGNDSQLLGCLAVTGQADTTEDQNAGSSGSLAQADAVQQRQEEGQPQEASAGDQQRGSLQQEEYSVEKQSQQQPELQGVSAEGTHSAQGWEARDSTTDGSHEAASWGMQEEASSELEGQFSAGQSCQDLSACGNG